MNSECNVETDVGQLTEKIDSLIDLSLTLYTIGKQYPIEKYNNGIIKLAQDFGYESDNPSLDEAIRFVCFSGKLTEAERIMFGDQFEALSKECDISGWLSTARELRNIFELRRQHYFYRRLFTSRYLGMMGMVNLPDRAKETMTAKWLDDMLIEVYRADKIRRDYGLRLSIEWEDIDGKIKEDFFAYKPQMADSRPEMTYWGQNAYDSAAQAAFWSTTENRWVMIPLNLITEVYLHKLDEKLSIEVAISRWMNSQNSEVGEDEDDEEDDYIDI